MVKNESLKNPTIPPFVMEKHLLEPMSGVETENDQFRIDLDWLISGKDIYLLELNFAVPTPRLSPTYSKMRHILSGLDKVQQHDIFEGFMPPHESDSLKFSSFKEQYPEVVYKRRASSKGNGVSVTVEPDWEPDFMELFVPPNTQEFQGKNYPYIIRHMIDVMVSPDEVHWYHNSIRRKMSLTAIQDMEDPNDAYKLNINSGFAVATEPSAEDIEICILEAPSLMEQIGMLTRHTDGDPRRYFSTASVYCYLGTVPEVPEGFSELANILQSHMKAHDITISWGMTMGGIERAMKADRCGADLVLLTSHHANGGDYLFQVVRDSNEIQHWGGGQIIATVPRTQNMEIINELPPDRLAEKLLRHYNSRS